MRANVRFAYWAEDADGVTWELTVRAVVDPGTRPVINRRPEDCDPGSPAEVLDIEVLDDELRPMTVTQIVARFGASTYEHIVREARISDVELPDPH